MRPHVTTLVVLVLTFACTPSATSGIPSATATFPLPTSTRSGTPNRINPSSTSAVSPAPRTTSPPPTGPTNTPYPPKPGFEEYIERTLASVLAVNQPPARYFPGLYFSQDSFPARTTVIFTGQSRPLTSAHEGLLEILTQNWNSPTELAGLYPSEYLFTKANLHLWIPVQGLMIPYIEEELTPGQEVTIFTRFAGAVLTEDTPDFVFLLNEFHE